MSATALTGKHAQVLYETNKAAIEGDSLADQFGAFGVRVYKVD